MPICSLHPLPYSADPIAFFARIREAPGAVLLDSGRPAAGGGRRDPLGVWAL
ncbi:aminodeoxychorismate synthase component I, partial [Pseudomonas congelans]